MNVTDNRLFPERGQWGQFGEFTMNGPTGPMMVMDATAQNASRFALTLQAQTNAWRDGDLVLTIRSAVESGVWERSFNVHSYGLCCEVPQGRCTASLKWVVGTVLSPFKWKSTFGEGSVSREWQTLHATVVVAGKVTVNAPNYARRVRVTMGHGTVPSTALISDNFGPIGIVANLVDPGGQTSLLVAAPDTVSISNTSPGEISASVEWEVLA